MLTYTRVNKDANPKPGKQRGCWSEFGVGEGSCSLETGAEPDFTFSPLFFPPYPCV